MLNDNNFFNFEIIAITIVTISILKILHSSILSQREALFQLEIQLLFVCYSDFEFLIFINDTSKISNLKSDLKSSTKIVLNNEIIIHKFNDDVVQIFTKLTIDYLDI